MLASVKTNENMRDTIKHCVRVANLTQMLVKSAKIKLSVTPQELFQAAFFHDVGKISWPEELFTKQSLSEKDWAIIHRHPFESVKTAINIFPRLSPNSAKIIRDHHERPGGTGYPAGREPSYEAIIIAACDVFDAMSSPRHYRPNPCTPDEIRAALDFAPPELANILLSLDGERRIFYAAAAAQ